MIQDTNGTVILGNDKATLTISAAGGLEFRNERGVFQIAPNGAITISGKTFDVREVSHANISSGLVSLGDVDGDGTRNRIVINETGVALESHGNAEETPPTV